MQNFRYSWKLSRNKGFSFAKKSQYLAILHVIFAKLFAVWQETFAEKRNVFAKGSRRSTNVTYLFERKIVCFKIMFIGLSSILPYQISGAISWLDLGFFFYIVLLHVWSLVSSFSILIERLMNRSSRLKCSTALHHADRWTIFTHNRLLQYPMLRQIFEINMTKSTNRRRGDCSICLSRNSLL